MDYMDPDVRCPPKDCSTYSLTHALFQCMVIGLHSTGEARTLELVDSQGHDGFPSNSFWMVYRPNKHRPFWITWAGHVTVLTTQQQMLADQPFQLFIEEHSRPLKMCSGYLGSQCGTMTLRIHVVTMCSNDDDNDKL